MMFKLFILTFISTLAVARPFTSAAQIQSFNCTLRSLVTKSTLTYVANPKGEVSVIRNGFKAPNYRINSAGKNYESGNSFIALSGGGFGNSQYIVLSMSSQIESGESQVNGSILLATLGGSVFAPQQISALPGANFYCDSLIIK